jgi:hypothetical protein
MENQMTRQLVIATFLSLALMAGTAIAKDNWRVIGSVDYQFPYQQSILEIGKENGRFEAIGIEVQGADVEIADLKLVYGNGEADNIQVRSVFKQGSQSRRINLKRGDRFIKQVIVTYRANGKAKILVYGDVADIKPQWVDLGCKSVSFGIDRDIIKVGRQDGLFSKLRLSVFDNAVEFYDVRVVYGNGQPDTLRVRSIIRPGEQTRDMDLSGKNRGISLIDLVYRSTKGFKGAKVCASGLMTP